MKKAVFAVLAAVLPAGNAAFADEHGDEGRDYSGPYIGVGGGRAHNNLLCDHVVDRIDEAADDDNFLQVGGVSFPGLTNASGKCENGAPAYKVFGGYDIGKYFGLEIGWTDLGRTETTRRERDGDNQRTTEADMEMDAQTIIAAALVKIPLGHNVQFFGKIGAHRWQLEAEGSAQRRDDLDDSRDDGTALANLAIDDDGTDLFYGVGVNHTSESGLGFRLEWERFQVNLDLESSAYAAGSTIDDSIDLYSLGVFYHF